MSNERSDIAFPKLSDAQIELLRNRGECRTLHDGDYLWRAGETDFCLFVVLRGDVDIIEESSGTPKRVTTHVEREFSGDIDLLAGRPSVVSGVARGECDILAVQPDVLRQVVREAPELGETILQAFLMRRELLLEQGLVGARVIGSRYSADTLRIREFLSRNRVPYTWIDLETDETADRLLDFFAIEKSHTPVVVKTDGNVMRNPENALLGAEFGVTKPVDGQVFDLVVVGAGPAGLAAGVYGASEGLATLVLDRVAPGGQAGTSSMIENYMGFPTGLSGNDLANRAVVQATKFGAQITVPAEVKRLSCGDGTHTLELADGQTLSARAVLIATGAEYRRLQVPGYSSCEGSGIYYAATVVESQLCTEADVAVIGAGNSAGQAAVFLSGNVNKVWMLVRGKSLEDSMSSYLARRIATIPNIEVLTETETIEVHGETTVDSVTVRHNPTGKTRCLEIVGLFVFTGAVPEAGWLGEEIQRDGKGFVLTGPDAQASGKWPLKRPPLFLETSCPGVFCAGDVRSGSVKRVASAVGEGAMAVAMVHQYLGML